MRAVIQRVSKASVTIDNQLKSSIGKGLLVLLGICEEDAEEDSRQAEVHKGAVQGETGTGPPVPPPEARGGAQGETRGEEDREEARREEDGEEEDGEEVGRGTDKRNNLAVYRSTAHWRFSRWQ